METIMTAKNYGNINNIDYISIGVFNVIIQKSYKSLEV